MSSSTVQTKVITTRIPARLDRLPWSSFHWRVVIGLGTVWILDGLESTMVGSVAARLTEAGSGITISPGQIGVAAAIYIVGACTGALFFGQLTDRFGRRNLFIVTLLLYMLATIATAFAFAPWYFFVARFFTGAGIGGEYAAINSAIDELIPARARGRVDLIINGSFWLGAAGGAALALLLLNESLLPTNLGWRLGFALGAVLAVGILLLRRHLPESPRWLFIHGREEEAERIVGDIEREVVEGSGAELPEARGSIRVRQRKTISFRMIADTAFRLYPRRAILGIALFVGQAFIYNAFTYNLGNMLGTFFGVASGTVPLFFIIWALANYTGPLTLGRLFDTVGRVPMIAGCYLGSTLITVPLMVTFAMGNTSEWVFLGFLLGVFFLASAGASAAYLTVSEVFPMETRALAIAFFYAIGTAVGGVTGPLLFGRMIDSGDRRFMLWGLAIGAVAMAVGGVAELVLGVRAERVELEDIAKPLTAHEAEAEDEAASGGEAGPAPGHPADDGVGQYRQLAQRHREEAEQLRAGAAERRARGLELQDMDGRRSGAAAAERDGGDPARAEALLAEAAELRAAGLDERARAAEEYAAAQEQVPQEETPPQEAGEEDAGAGQARHRAEAAQLSARAAEQRAASLAERELALAAAGEADLAAHTARAAAAADRARAYEQLALAESALAAGPSRPGAEQQVAGARSAMHREWAQLYQARADLHLARADGDGAAAARADGRAGAAERRALAAEQRVVAAEHLAAAAGVRREREAAEESREHQPAELDPQRVERAERHARDEEVDRRIRARIARRESRERAGLRRLRPGPSTRLPAPFAGVSPGAGAQAEAALDREVEVLARALAEHGPTDREELARLVGARYWGPGRFGGALRTAVDEGRVRRLSRRTYGPVGDATRPAGSQDEPAGR